MRRAFLLLGLLAGAQDPEKLSPPALNEMVETERAFAAMGAEKGVRESFFEFFGEEGISFTPHPAKYREFARKNPVSDPPPPREFKLEWWPVHGDVAESGDLGYNTGPTLVTDLTPQNRPSRHGYFFSVWKKQRNGLWRVAVDMGAESPGPDPAHQERLRYERASQEPYKKEPLKDAAQGRSEILALESRFRDALVSQGVRDGYLGIVAENARVHRVKTFPVLGKKAIGDYFRDRNLTVVDWEGIDGGVAASGELGYSYGRYQIRQDERSEKGYFTHVWKRDGNGEWKLVADVTSPLPRGSVANGVATRALTGIRGRFHGRSSRSSSWPLRSSTTKRGPPWSSHQTFSDNLKGLSSVRTTSAAFRNSSHSAARPNQTLALAPSAGSIPSDAKRSISRGGGALCELPRSPRCGHRVLGSGGPPTTQQYIAPMTEYARSRPIS